jgi:hypothetical protein
MWWGIFFLHSGIWGNIWDLNRPLVFFFLYLMFYAYVQIFDGTEWKVFRWGKSSGVVSHPTFLIGTPICVRRNLWSVPVPTIRYWRVQVGRNNRVCTTKTASRTEGCVGRKNMCGASSVQKWKRTQKAYFSHLKKMKIWTFIVHLYMYPKVEVPLEKCACWNENSIYKKLIWKWQDSYACALDRK